jgi:hypothetical protein
VLSLQPAAHGTYLTGGSVHSQRGKDGRRDKRVSAVDEPPGSSTALTVAFRHAGREPQACSATVVGRDPMPSYAAGRGHTRHLANLTSPTGLEKF